MYAGDAQLHNMASLLASCGADAQPLGGVQNKEEELQSKHTQWEAQLAEAAKREAAEKQKRRQTEQEADGMAASAHGILVTPINELNRTELLCCLLQSRRRPSARRSSASRRSRRCFGSKSASSRRCKPPPTRTPSRLLCKPSGTCRYRMLVRTQVTPVRSLSIAGLEADLVKADQEKQQLLRANLENAQKFQQEMERQRLEVVAVRQPAGGPQRAANRGNVRVPVTAPKERSAWDKLFGTSLPLLSDLVNPIKYGLLFKRSAWFRRWDKRLVVLVDSMMYYFDSYNQVHFFFTRRCWLAGLLAC